MKASNIVQALNYAPLSPAAVTVAENILKSATYDGKPINAIKISYAGK